MSSDIWVNIYRGGLQGALVASNVYVQLDTMSTQEAAYLGGPAPYFRFNGFILSPTIDVQHQDMLVDTKNLEPKTQPPNTRTRQYRVINDPEYFFDHIEVSLDRYFGNTP